MAKVHVEAVKIKSNQKLEDILADYGFRKYLGVSPAGGTGFTLKPEIKKAIWDHCSNHELRLKRKTPDKIQAGDTIHVPMPWEIKTREHKSLGIKKVKDYRTKQMIDIGKIKLVLATGVVSPDEDLYRWVQTIDQGNQPNEFLIQPGNKSHSPPRFTNRQCVDPCPPKTDEPFYFPSPNNSPEHFNDSPSRAVPTTAMGTTKWRATTSFVVVNKNQMRVSLIQSVHWGFDLSPDKKIILLPFRQASDAEINTHLKLLQAGKDINGQSFVSTGWTFSKANLVDCPAFRLKM